MVLSILRPVTAGFRIRRQLFSHSAVDIQRLRSHDRNVFLFIRELAKNTEDELWTLIHRLKFPNTAVRARDELDFDSSARLHYAQLRLWQPVFVASDLSEALPLTGATGNNAPEFQHAASASNQTSNDEQHIPAWILMYLACYKVRTSQASCQLVDLVNSHLLAIPSHLHAALLVLTALNLSTFGILNLMPDMVQKFLAIPLPDPWLYFNLLLHSVSRFPKSREAGNLAISLIHTMRARSISLRSHTYDLLLADNFCTMELMNVVRSQMLHEGFSPTASQLESFVRLCAQNRDADQAGKYLNAIRAQVAESKAAVSPADFDPRTVESMPAVQQARTLFLASLDSRSSAFAHLSELVKKEANLPSPAPENPSWRFERFSQPRTRVSPERRRLYFNRTRPKSSIDVYDWTMALSVAARDKTGTTGAQLVHMLERARTETAAFRPTTVTYTVVLVGLLHRKAFAEAEEVWRQFRLSGLHVDDVALTVGLEILTRAGKPHVAFMLLEYYTAPGSAARDGPGPTPTTVEPVASNCEAGEASRSKVIPDSYMLTEFMVALMRIGRPDVVFLLWQHMETLYAINPSVHTLNVFLRAAHVAGRLDGFLRSTWTEVAATVKRPFTPSYSAPKMAPPAVSREEALAVIVRTLGTIDDGLRPYSSSMWDGRPAWEMACGVFRQVVLSNHPRLLNIQSPVKALRQSSDDAALSPMVDLAREFNVPFLSSSREESSTDMSVASSPAPPARSSHFYPQITVSNDTFFNYIQLLGLNDSAAEIPLALAWMRALAVKPAPGTVALALVFWGEVSMHATRFAAWGAERDGQEFGGLLGWLREWVDEGAIPDREEFGRWLKIIKKMRERMS